MTNTKQHLLDMIVEHTIESMDYKDMLAYVQASLYIDYQLWTETQLKVFLDENWPLDE